MLAGLGVILLSCGSVEKKKISPGSQLLCFTLPDFDNGVSDNGAGVGNGLDLGVGPVCVEGELLGLAGGSLGETARNA